jgi:hypothetical protein
VFVKYTENDDGKGLQLPELNALSKAHKMVVSMLTRGGFLHDMELFLAMDSVDIHIYEWKQPIQALGIVRGEGKSVEDAWLPPLASWETATSGGGSSAALVTSLISPP